MLELKGLIKDVILKNWNNLKFINPSKCSLKHFFNLFRLEKAQVAQDEQYYYSAEF